MSDMFQDFSGGEPLEPEPEQYSAAPPLPAEGHVVAAALGVAHARDLCQQMIVGFKYAPRDRATLSKVFHEIRATLVQVDRDYTAYLEVLGCKGQA